jgi:hypothetical protein
LPETAAEREQRLAGTAGHRFQFSAAERRLYCCTRCGMRTTELVLNAHDGVFPPCPGAPPPARKVVLRDRVHAFHAHQFLGIGTRDAGPAQVRCMRCGLAGTVDGLLSGAEDLPVCELVVAPF